MVLSLLPTLVKEALGGGEEVVTAYLAIFSIGIALGSAVAAWLASGRIVLLPTPIAAIVMGLFMLDVGFVALNATPAAEPGLVPFFTSGPGIHVALDFLGLAIAGGIFIVPAFAAVQAWSEADERARVIAAINVLSAALMVLGGVVVAGRADARRRHADAVPRDGSPQRHRRPGDPPLPADQPAPRFPLDPLPRHLPGGGEGGREPQEGRPQPDHRAQPCQLSRRGAGAVAP